jgi:hypothetical protein
MSLARADIERIVREVMQQLNCTTEPAAAPAPTAVPPLAAAPQNGDLFIDARVVTMESLGGRLNGAKQLVVSPGALVTPSVRDELRRRGIELKQECAAKNAMRPLASVLLIAGRNGGDPEMAVQTLRQAGVDVKTELTNCLIEAAGKLAAAVAGRSLGILWTRHTAVALCLANRYRSVRAVLAAGVPATVTAVAAVGANVLVVDPTAGTLYERKQVLREFCLGGIRECPQELKEVLGLRT